MTTTRALEGYCGCGHNSMLFLRIAVDLGCRFEFILCPDNRLQIYDELWTILVWSYQDVASSFLLFCVICNQQMMHPYVWNDEYMWITYNIVILMVVDMLECCLFGFVLFKKICSLKYLWSSNHFFIRQRCSNSNDFSYALFKICFHQTCFCLVLQWPMLIYGCL